MPTEGLIAVLAGSGRLPVELVDYLDRTGASFRIMALRGFTDRVLTRRADAVVDLLDIGRILDVLQSWRPAMVTLAGAVGRPGPGALLGASSFLRNRAEIQRVFSGGDDRLLRGAVRLLEEHGHRVVGAHELAPHLLAHPDLRSRTVPNRQDEEAIRTGFALLDALSEFDVGQGAVVEGTRVLAVEGPEGTDSMLRRVARMRHWPFGRRRCSGVLVKTLKKDQDVRVDMPAVGPRTIREAMRAGLAGIALGEGATLIVDRAEMLRQADRQNIFVVSVPMTEEAAGG
jgi:UDP-2,3-diacylglucosamine hydrolase